MKHNALRRLCLDSRCEKKFPTSRLYQMQLMHVTTLIITTLSHNVYYQILTPSSSSMTVKTLTPPTFSCCFQCTPVVYIIIFQFALMRVSVLSTAILDNAYANLTSPCLPWPLRWVPSNTADCQVPQQKDRTCGFPYECKPHIATPPHHPVGGEKMNKFVY